VPTGTSQQHKERMANRNTFWFIFSVVIAIIAVLSAINEQHPRGILFFVVFRSFERAHILMPWLIPRPISPQAKVWETFFNIFNPLHFHFEDDVQTVKFWRGCMTVISWFVPSDPDCTAEELIVGSQLVRRVKVRNRRDEDLPIVFYIHGGGHVFGDFETYQSFTCKAAKRMNAQLYYISYPFSPDYGSVVDQVESVMSVVREVPYTGKKAFLMGDSAGGGLALRAAQQMHVENMEPVAALGLLCPFLDLSTSYDSAITNRGNDLMITERAIKRMAKMAVQGQTELFNGKCCNPYLGDWKNLPPIVVATSTHEVLHGDTLNLIQKATEANVPIHVITKEHMQHVWMLSDGLTPEATSASEELQFKMIGFLEKP
jgi:monoterpene epsilon-lactone hydrolase